MRPGPRPLSSEVGYKWYKRFADRTRRIRVFRLFSYMSTGQRAGKGTSKTSLS